MEPVEWLRRLSRHVRIDSILMYLVLFDRIQRRTEQLRTDELCSILLETFKFRKQCRLKQCQEHRRDIRIADKISSGGLKRNADAVDVADYRLLIEIDIIGGGRCQLSATDYNTFFILTDTPETISTELLELAGCKSVFLRSCDSGDGNIAERSMRISSGTHSSKSSRNAVIGNRLSVVHRTVCEHNRCTAVGNRFSSDDACHNLSVVSQRVINVGNSPGSNICCLITCNIYLILVVGTGNTVALITYAQYISFNNSSHSKQRRIAECYSSRVAGRRRRYHRELRSVQLLFSRNVAASIQILRIRNLLTGLIGHKVEQIFRNFCIGSTRNNAVNTIGIGNEISRIVVHFNRAVVGVLLCSSCEVYERTIGLRHCARNSNTKRIIRTDFAEHPLDIIDIGNHTIGTYIAIGPTPVLDVESTCQNGILCLTDTEVHGRLCVGLN